MNDSDWLEDFIVNVISGVIKGICWIVSSIALAIIAVCKLGK
jgi:hypothetical protein